MAKTLNRLSSTLEKILKARGFQGRLHEYRIYGKWEKTVGRVIARHARPLSVRGKKLTVVVDSPAWMQQLSLLKPEIVEKLNAGLGGDAIKDLSLKIGEVTADHEDEGAEEPAGPPLGTSERARIAAYVEGITDADTRETIRRVIEKDLLKRKKGKR